MLERIEAAEKFDLEIVAKKPAELPPYTNGKSHDDEEK